jgi:hypothetical protein
VTEDYLNLMAGAVPEEEARLYTVRGQQGARKRRHKSWTVQGPFPWPQFCLVARLEGKVLVVWLLIQHRQRMSKQPWVTLPTELLLEAGVDRKAKYHALDLLESHGLIRTIRNAGCSTRIAFVPYEHDADEEDVTT